MYHLDISAGAEKQMRRLPAKIHERVLNALDGLKKDPRPRGCKKLKGEDNLWRIRVGDYRIAYTIEDDKLIVLVVRVAHRKDVYKG
jgi:mRNA interferase RelE/StbE